MKPFIAADSAEGVGTEKYPEPSTASSASDTVVSSGSSISVAGSTVGLEGGGGAEERMFMPGPYPGKRG